MTAREIVELARALVGCRFRPQGRDPQTGLDCVGLVVLAFAIPVEEVRRDYRIGGRHGAALEAELRRFLRPATTAGAGDVLLCAITPEQAHLAIYCGASFIHADAGLRRIVETPGAPPWPAAAFRHPDLIQD